jgi:methyl-accepting chemotaxis protein
VQSVRQVGEFVTHISDATDRQREGIEMVNQSVGDLDASTQQNHVLVEQAGQAAQALQDVAQQLGQAVDQFQLDGPGGHTPVYPVPQAPRPATRRLLSA